MSDLVERVREVLPSVRRDLEDLVRIESVWADRPLAVLRYPALEEILALGFSFLPADDPDAVAEALRRPDASTAARNHQLAEVHFSMDALERSLDALLRTV